MTEGCIFCQIIAGGAPATKLYEDDLTLVIMDIFPWTTGHSLIISKQHAPTLFELEDATAEAVMRTAVKVAPAIKSALRADGLNLFQSNGRAAWQTVDHFHMHVLPRYFDDGLVPPKIPGPADAKEIAETAAKISEVLG